MIGWSRVVISISPTLCRHMKISKSSFLFAFESKSFGEPHLFFIQEKNLLLGCIPLAVDDGQAFQLIAKDAEASLGFFQCLETQCILKLNSVFLF